MHWKAWVLGFAFVAVGAAMAAEVKVERLRVPGGARPHDVAPAPEPGGPVWYTAQGQGALGVPDPATGQTRQIPLGRGSAPHAEYVDKQDQVWVSDFAANAMLRFDPRSERFQSFPSPQPDAAIRQILGRAGKVWAPESGIDHLVVYRTH